MRLISTLILIMAVLLSAGCAEEPSAGKTATKRQGRTVDPRARVLLAQATDALQKNDLQQAMQYLESADRYDPGLPQTTFLRGHVLLAREHLPEARAAFKAVLEHDPTYEAAWHGLGDVAFREGRVREALRNYRREIEINPTPQTWYNVGNVYRTVEEPDSARMAYEKALSFEAQYTPTYQALAELYEDLGDYEAALTNARIALEREPDNPAYRYLVGAMLFRTDHLDESYSVLREAAAQRPWDYSTLYTLAQVLQRQGRSDEAEDMFERAEDARHRESEIRAIERQTRVRRDSVMVHIALAEQLVRANRIDEALERYHVALLLDPDHIGVKQNVAALYLRKGDTNQAIALSSSVVAADSTRVGAWVILSYAFAATGDTERSGEAWEKALQIDPEHPTVQQAVASQMARRNRGAQ